MQEMHEGLMDVKQDDTVEFEDSCKIYEAQSVENSEETITIGRYMESIHEFPTCYSEDPNDSREYFEYKRNAVVNWRGGQTGDKQN